MQTIQPQPISERNRQKNPNLEKAHRDLFRRKDYFIDGKTQFQSGASGRSGLHLVLWSWMSAFIDTLILISITCFSLILFSVLMKTQARDILKLISFEPNILLMFIFSFLFSFWVYMIMLRVFMGASLGEWACQLRLGQPVERMNAGYVLRVIARTTLLLLTGFVALPVLSLLFKRDLLGDITGIRLYSLT